MRFTIIFCLAIIFSAQSFAQTQVIKEIDYSYERVANISSKSVRKNVFIYGADSNKVQVLDLKKDSGQATFDTITKYTIVYDTAKKQVIQTSFIKRSKGSWKKQAEVITSYNKDKAVSDIEWKILKKDKLVAYRKFSYSYDSLNRPKEIKYDAMDTTGKYKPDSRLVYEYNNKKLKSCSLLNYGEDKKWLKRSMYTVMFDSSDIVVSLIKFKNGSRLEDRYSLDNSYNASTQTRTLTFKNYHPETKEYAGRPLNESYVAANYNNNMISKLTAFTRDDKKGTWVQAITARYTYGDAGHLNSALKSYLKYDALTARYDDFVGESYITDVNGFIDASKLTGKEPRKSVLFSMDGPMIKYFVQ